MDDNNKRDYSDFFRTPGEESNDKEQRSGTRKDSEDRESYYYSYGPYKSQEPVSEEQAGATPVEVTPPKPLRSMSFSSSDEGAPRTPSGNGNMGNWQFGQPKKSSRFKSAFTAFLAGAVVVGGLMFAADTTNLFTGTKGVMAGNGSSSSSGSGKLVNDGGVTSTNLDLGRPNNISQMVQQASPAVVKIETKVKSKSSGRSSNPLFDDPFFRQFFGDDFFGGSRQQQPNNNDQLQPGGMGTGFIFEKSGYILTNEHVIEGADEIWVTVQGYDKPFKATLLGNSYDLDLAALKIEGEKEFPTLPLGNANDLNVGDWVVAIGNPYGFDHTVTVGVLSAKERPISIPDQKGTRNYQHLLQTDASINPGNSGGPLLNTNGEVIGINVAVSAQAQGIGFAIPTSTVSAVLDNLKNNVKIPKEPIPYIGVQLANIDKDWVAELKLENTDGAIISQVERRSPAFQAGLRPYDVVTEVNGAKVKTSEELSSSIKKLKVGDKVTLTVIRNGQKMPIDVVIGDRNAEQK
ncbi:S1C family serine protease [Paenibacillus silviterrae]|uniref:S1C family serine protease n=1 Tax=Paenibacillus silviterrae TaxID=3242194 RepID=UPI002543A633|nr:trypsin-like peptidase domain-containing protein [Paenibacillus chinjuensis]